MANGKTDAKEKIRSIIKSYRTIHLADQAMKTIVEKAADIPVTPYLYKFAGELAFESSEYEEVKFGIALFGVVGCSKEDITRVKTLGLHEEFTLYSVVTLHSQLADSDLHIWALARSTFRWGRLNSIEQMKHTTDRDIKRWLLRESYNNTVMNEYTACICTVTGGLKQAIAVDILDDELLTGACEIIKALLNDDGTGGIDDYTHAAVVCERYVKHAGKRGQGVAHFALLVRIKKYIENPMADWNKRALCGWGKKTAIDLADQIAPPPRQRTLADRCCMGNGCYH